VFGYFAKKCAFIKQRTGDYSIRRLCLTLIVHPGGYYSVAV